MIDDHIYAIGMDDHGQTVFVSDFKYLHSAMIGYCTLSSDLKDAIQFKSYTEALLFCSFVSYAHQDDPICFCVLDVTVLLALLLPLPDPLPSDLKEVGDSGC